MPNVHSVLRRYMTRTPPPSLGPVLRSETQHQAFANDLMAASRTNTVYFAICFGAVVAVLIGAAFVAIRYLESPDTIRTIFAVLGISVTGLTAQMAALWKQKVSADMMLILARNIDEAQMKTVVETLLAKL